MTEFVTSRYWLHSRCGDGYPISRRQVFSRNETTHIRRSFRRVNHVNRVVSCTGVSNEIKESLVTRTLRASDFPFKKSNFPFQKSEIPFRFRFIIGKVEFDEIKIERKCTISAVN